MMKKSRRGMMPNRQVNNEFPERMKVLGYGIHQNEVVPLSIDDQGRLLTTGGGGNVSVDNFPTSACGDLRTIELSPVAGWTFNYTLLTNLIRFTGVSTGSQTVANSMIQLSTGTATDGSATIETRKALRYSPGLGALVRFTAVFSKGLANSQQIIGIGDDADGFFFGYNGETFGILVRKNGTNTWIPQSSWNIDQLNGSGSSGLTLVQTLGNVYQIEYQWLGFGQITFSVENPVDGKYIPVHAIQYANQNLTPSIFNPTLPLKASVTNTGNNTNLTLSSASAMAFIEGPSFTTAISSRYSYFRLLNVKSGVLTNLFTLRNASLFNGKINRVRIRLDYLSCATNTANLTQFFILTGATLTGGTFTPVSAGQSVVEASTDATFTGGTVLLYQGVSEGSSAGLVISSLDIFLAPGEILVVRAQSQGTGDVTASLSWVEYY